MPQTVLSIATVKLSREMLRREDCYEGNYLLLYTCPHLDFRSTGLHNMSPRFLSQDFASPRQAIPAC